ncbi:MSCRAMM family adhesin SdrC [Priestia aryabhattai]|uniref:MSCRAMM family adhesin SdrC n=1 Tax=Priestia aryabhattai TaxID=412384 RepID=UPI00203D5C00|nr:MSCRAMM family adhesin SdrC [Priestia aryabhattai]MCM3774148.1 MSCRAMM family adhesin SdrC [Priestia aryabhattai]
MNYYVYIPYCPLIYLYQSPDHKYRNSNPGDMYYTHPNYFDYRFYSVPTYHEIGCQIDKRIVRKEKGNLDLDTSSNCDSDPDTSSNRDSDLDTSSNCDSDPDTSSNRDSDLDTSSNCDSDLDTSSNRDSDLDTSSNRDSDLDTSSNHGPYGDISLIYQQMIHSKIIHPMGLNKKS